jgi:hypothetical protein
MRRHTSSLRAAGLIARNSTNARQCVLAQPRCAPRALADAATAPAPACWVCAPSARLLHLQAVWWR